MNLIKFNSLEPLRGVYICLGHIKYGIGNTPIEAYTNYKNLFRNSESNPLEIYECRFYFTSQFVTYIKEN